MDEGAEEAAAAAEGAVAPYLAAAERDRLETLSIFSSSSSRGFQGFAMENGGGELGF